MSAPLSRLTKPEGNAAAILQYCPFGWRKGKRCRSRRGSPLHSGDWLIVPMMIEVSIPSTEPLDPSSSPVNSAFASVIAFWS
jgi:hypothetical protein